MSATLFIYLFIFIIYLFIYFCILCGFNYYNVFREQYMYSVFV